mmetsp:Transcript_62769/g.147677  ORF Transcript_62769/g.147677 Transcript_62769/m.147677 type:complete len:233 (+) Transcript_62769:2069-2767(+)
MARAPQRRGAVRRAAQPAGHARGHVLRVCPGLGPGTRNRRVVRWPGQAAHRVRVHHQPSPKVPRLPVGGGPRQRRGPRWRCSGVCIQELPAPLHLARGSTRPSGSATTCGPGSVGSVGSKCRRERSSGQPAPGPPVPHRGLRHADEKHPATAVAVWAACERKGHAGGVAEDSEPAREPDEALGPAVGVRAGAAEHVVEDWRHTAAGQERCGLDQLQAAPGAEREQILGIAKA